MVLISYQIETAFHNQYLKFRIETSVENILLVKRLKFWGGGILWKLQKVNPCIRQPPMLQSNQDPNCLRVF